MLSEQQQQTLKLNSLSFLSGLNAFRDVYLSLEANNFDLSSNSSDLSSEEASLIESFKRTSQELEGLLPEAEQVVLRLLRKKHRSEEGVLSPEVLNSFASRNREAQKINLEKVLIVPKLSKIEYEMRKNGLDYQQTLSLLEKQFGDCSKLILAHEQVINSIDRLKKFFRLEQFIDRDQLSAENLADASLVIALGGDDHFCYVSQNIKGLTPVLGMKADDLSLGYLLPSSSYNTPKLVRDLENAEYKLEAWSRLKVVVDGKELPPTLSTVFVGESNTQYVSRNTIFIEDINGNRLHGTEGQGIEQKSSGTLIYTGTGSSGWALGASLYLFPSGKTFSPSSRYAELLTREPSLIDRSNIASLALGDSHNSFSLPKLSHAIIHEGEKVIISSLNKDGGVVSADSVTVPFRRGSKVEIEVSNQPLWVLIPSSLKAENCRSELAAGYPNRNLPKSKNFDWSIPCPDYKPIFFESEKLKTADWAEKSSIPKSEFERRLKAGELRSLVAELRLDPENGWPLNPSGRTGICGRGVLGKYGPNQAVDPIVLYKDGSSFKLLVIQRKGGAWALPGGFVDQGEEVLTALLRELKEETNIQPEAVLPYYINSFSYAAYCDDPRATDNAWIETTPGLFILPKDLAEKLIIKAGSDAQDVKWLSINSDNISELYASHSMMVTRALSFIFNSD